MAQTLCGGEIVDVVRRHLECVGRRPTVAEAAATLGVSPVQLRRLLKRTGRATFKAMLTEVCLSHAASLIREGMKIEAAMRLAGFRNKTNFNKQFARRFGMLPKKYRTTRYAPPRLVEFDVRFVLQHVLAGRCASSDRTRLSPERTREASRSGGETTTLAGRRVRRTGGSDEPHAEGSDRRARPFPGPDHGRAAEREGRLGELSRYAHLLRVDSG